MDGLQNRIGIGVTVRDPEGQVISTFQATRNFKASTQMTESHAAMLGATYSNANKLGLQQIIVEGNALQVVKNIQKEKEKENSSTLGALAEDVKLFLHQFNSA